MAETETIKTEEAGNEQPIKTEDSAGDSCDKAKKIVEQVEFYFGNINLPRDKFLQGEMKKELGWIPLETMLKFNRLAKLSEDINEIANALKISSLMEVSEDNSKIRRSQDHPMPDNTLEYWQEIKRRTVYVKGFPQDASLDDVMQFMNQFGVTDNISLRHTKSVPRVFKGSAFVTYATKDVAESCVKQAEGKEFKSQPITKNAEKSIKQAKKAQTVEEQKQSLAATHFIKGLILKVLAMLALWLCLTMRRISDLTATMTIWLRRRDVLAGDEEQKYWDEFHKSKIAKSERMNSKQGKFNKRGKGSRDDAPRGKKRPAGEVSGISEDKKAKRIVFKDDDEEETKHAATETVSAPGEVKAE
uniref:La-related protein 7 n=1 Tax=Ditylenchus dipsaci TaxID=166011 RepID=A0A915CV15_9BILA